MTGPAAHLNDPAFDGVDRASQISGNSTLSCRSVNGSELKPAADQFTRLFADVQIGKCTQVAMGL